MASVLIRETNPSTPLEVFGSKINLNQYCSVWIDENCTQLSILEQELNEQKAKTCRHWKWHGRPSIP